MRSVLPFALLLTACGSKFGDVDMVITISNLSGYDFVASNLCTEDQFGDVVCAEMGAMEDGFVYTHEQTVFDEYGAEITVDAAAVDVDGDGYLWGPRTYTVAESMDIHINFTLDDCCYDF